MAVVTVAEDQKRSSVIMIQWEWSCTAAPTEVQDPLCLAAVKAADCTFTCLWNVCHVQAITGWDNTTLIDQLHKSLMVFFCIHCFEICVNRQHSYAHTQGTMHFTSQLRMGAGAVNLLATSEYMTDKLKKRWRHSSEFRLYNKEKAELIQSKRRGKSDQWRRHTFALMLFFSWWMVLKPKIRLTDTDVALLLMWVGWVAMVAWPSWSTSTAVLFLYVQGR